MEIYNSNYYLNLIWIAVHVCHHQYATKIDEIFSASPIRHRAANNKIFFLPFQLVPRSLFHFFLSEVWSRFNFLTEQWFATAVPIEHTFHSPSIELLFKYWIVGARIASESCLRISYLILSATVLSFGENIWILFILLINDYCMSVWRSYAHIPNLIA